MIQRLRPSEVRLLMLRECELLRAALDVLTARSEREPEELRAGIVDLRDRLRNYLRKEQELLLPALEATDHHGPGRLASMRAAHATHFFAAEELARAAVKPESDPRELAARLCDLRFDLCRDLDEDERCLLIAEVLQDHAYGQDQTDG